MGSSPVREAGIFEQPGLCGPPLSQAVILTSLSSTLGISLASRSSLLLFPAESTLAHKPLPKHPSLPPFHRVILSLSMESSIFPALIVFKSYVNKGRVCIIIIIIVPNNKITHYINNLICNSMSPHTGMFWYCS